MNIPQNRITHAGHSSDTLAQAEVQTRILILGAGAVGGYFGGRMTAAGADVTFLVREGRAAQLADGLRIESMHGDADVAVRTLTPGVPADPFDIVILTCKAYGLDDALETIAPHVQSGTAILPLLNGYSHLARIEARFPEASVWGGSAGCAATLTPDGVVRHFDHVQFIVAGTRKGNEATKPLLEEFIAILGEANVDGTLVEDADLAMWEKWVFLAPFAAATCLFQADVGTIIRTAHGGVLLPGMLDECAAVAEAEGKLLRPEVMETYRGFLTNRESTMTASMARDMQTGGPTEAHHVLGEMILLAEIHGIATPLLRSAYTRLQVYEAGRG